MLTHTPHSNPISRSPYTDDPNVQVLWKSLSHAWYVVAPSLPTVAE